MAPPVQRPPREWIEEQDELFGMDEIHALKLWCSMSFGQRHNFRRRLITLKKVRKKVSAGSTDPRLVRAASTGIYRRTHDSAEAAERQWDEDKRNRHSKRWLDFRQSNATGCSVPGCVLQGPLCLALVPLIEHDHVDDSSKLGEMSHMPLKKRDAELQKTICVCLWHHQLHTRVQNGIKPAVDRPGGARRKLSFRKEQLGCQHPLHSSMVYASLVPAAKDDPLMYGFLHVSHVSVGPKADHKDSSKIRDLDRGAAVIHCAFCHKLYTVLEYSKLHARAASRAYEAAMRAKFPEFCAHFDSATAGTDWEKHSKSIHAKQVTAKRGLQLQPTLFEYGYEKKPKRFQIFWNRPASSLKSAVAQITSAFFTIVDDDSA